MENRKSESGQKPAAGTRHRQYRGAAGTAVKSFAAAVMLYSLVYVSGVLVSAGIDIYGGIHRSVILTFILVMVFLLFPATRKAPTHRLPWYDAVLVILSLVTGGYLVLNIIRIERTFLPANTLEQVFAMTMVVLVLEASRRAVSWIVTLLGIVFFTYPFYAQFLPGVLQSAPFTLRRVATTVYLDSEAGINGSIMEIMAVIIVVFVTFGIFLLYSGAGQFFINTALTMVGRFRGGPAKVSIVASSLFGTISGVGTANAATTGIITIPLMKSIGYRPEFAGAVEAVSSIGGMIMPPVLASIAFIMADFLGVSYLQVVVASILPAILYYLAIFIMVDFEAAKNGLRGIPRAELPSLKRTLTGGWFYLLPIVVLVFLLVGLHYRPQTAGIYSLATLVPVSFLARKENWLTPRRIWRALGEAGQDILEVGAAIAVAGTLLTTMQLTGVGITISGQLVEVAGGNMLLLLVLTAAIGIVMGMAVGPTPVYITLALLTAPALVFAGVVPMAAHMFLFYLATVALISPPVCVVSFITATIAEANFMKTGYLAMRLGITAFIVPFIFVYSPELLMIGSVSDIVLAAVTAVVGIYLMSAGMEGYLLTHAGWWERGLLTAAGIAMLVPGWIADITGFGLGMTVLLWQMRQARAVPVEPRKMRLSIL